MFCFSKKPLDEDRIERTLEASQSVLGFSKDAHELTLITGLGVAAGALYFIIDFVQRVRGHTQTREQLASQLQTLANALRRAHESVQYVINKSCPDDREKIKDDLRRSQELTERIDTLVKALLEIKKNAANPDSSRFFLRRLRGWDSTALRSIQTRIKSVTETGSQLTVEQIVTDISYKIVERREQIWAMEAEKVMRDDGAALEIFRQKLTVEASFLSQHNEMKSHLLPGTRTPILDDMEAWAIGGDDTHQPPFFVLAGASGAGKSTIAYEFARRLDRDKLLGATFFFVRGDEKVSTTRFIVPTLAYQLSQNQPELFSSIATVVRKRLCKGQIQKLEDQLNDLIVIPLKALPSSRPLIIVVIDAVDECTLSAQDEVVHLLYILQDNIHRLSLPLRILITTRSDLHIENALRSSRFRDIAEPLKLYAIPRSAVDDDITLYLSDRLKQFPYSEELMMKRPKAVMDLTTRASGLFIYASTALDFLIKEADGPDFAVKRLDILLANVSESAIFKSQLDSLYVNVLAGAFPKHVLENEDPNYKTWLRDVLGAIAVAQDHISPKTLEYLLGVATSNTHGILALLSSLVVVPSEDATIPMRPRHATFPQFLVDPARCTDETFLVDPSSFHSRLALRCLQALAEPDALSGILSPHLQYSCVHWPTHMANTNTSCPDLLNSLDDFIRKNLLKWFEALSYIHRIEIAAPALLRLHTWYQDHVGPHESNAQTLELLYDGYRFILEYLVPIQDDPRQIYASALPLMPACALFDAYGRSSYGQGPTVRLVTGRDDRWGACLRVPEGHAGCVRSVRFSPDSRYLVSDANDGTVRTWDVSTGAALNVMKDNGFWVNAVSFSPDPNNRQIVCGSNDGIIRIWDFASGAPLHTVCPVDRRFRPAVHSVAYSPDGKYIISGSDQDVLCLWNAIDDKPSGIEAGSRVSSVVFSTPSPKARHLIPRAVYSIAFSLDGSMVVTTAMDTVRISDVRSGRLLKEFGGASPARDAAFTFDGTRVVSGANDHTVQVWAVEAGTCTRVLEGHTGPVTAIAVSQELIASGDAYSTIRLWDVESYQLLSVLKNHTDMITSLSFSPDGVKLASASYDNTVRIWDVVDRGTRTVVEPDSSVRCLAFSNDGARIAAGTADMTITMWETTTGKRLQTWKCHQGNAGFYSLAFSPDGRRLVSGGMDEYDVQAAVMIWDTESGELLKRSTADYPNDYEMPIVLASVAYSPDGKWIAGAISTGPGSKPTSYIWHASNGALVRTGVEFKSDTQSLEFSPSGGPRMHVKFDAADASIIWSTSSGEIPRWRSASAKEAFKSEEEWVLLKQSNKKLCWLTGNRRAYTSNFTGMTCFASFGNYCAIGATSGQVTVLDMSELVD